jgi:hypothetical protein
MDSYRAAVDDPSDEMVHLYEIRDALRNHYGNEAEAMSQLGVTKREWQELGDIANVRPVQQSRHRGDHVAGRQPATTAELETARRAARRLIEAFAKKV